MARCQRRAWRARAKIFVPILEEVEAPWFANASESMDFVDCHLFLYRPSDAAHAPWVTLTDGALLLDYPLIGDLADAENKAGVWENVEEGIWTVLDPCSEGGNVAISAPSNAKFVRSTSCARSPGRGATTRLSCALLPRQASTASIAWYCGAWIDRGGLWAISRSESEYTRSRMRVPPRRDAVGGTHRNITARRDTVSFPPVHAPGHPVYPSPEEERRLPGRRRWASSRLWSDVWMENPRPAPRSPPSQRLAQARADRWPSNPLPTRAFRYLRARSSSRRDDARPRHQGTRRNRMPRPKTRLLLEMRWRRMIDPGICETIRQENGLARHPPLRLAAARHQLRSASGSGGNALTRAATSLLPQRARQRSAPTSSKPMPQPGLARQIPVATHPWGPTVPRRHRWAGRRRARRAQSPPLVPFRNIPRSTCRPRLCQRSRPRSGGRHGARCSKRSI
jgi:hypothetical protein